MELNTFICSDCLEAMRKMPDSSVDAVVTDPPYHLTQVSRGGSPRKNDPETPFGRTRIGERGFMGKTWDGGGVAHNPEIWKEALRIAKPGTHLLAFGGTRTFHRLACAIEDAGWEIRDDIAFLSSMSDKEQQFFFSLSPDQQQAFMELFASQDLLGWMYGSGFPKSHNISKTLDRKAGAERKIIGVSKGKGGENLNKIARLGGNDSRNAKGCGAYGQGAKQVTIDIPITAPTTDDAKKWSGWGTSIKPAWEPIICARKPLGGTVVNNVLKWGTGGINIDDCRVPTGDVLKAGSGGLLSHVRDGKPYPNGRKGEKSVERRYTKEGGTNFSATPGPYGGSESGRFPANLIHDGSADVLAVFPEAKGQQGDLINHNKNRKSPNGCFGEMAPANNHIKRDDSGSSARFFYCAKASKKERGEGNTHPTLKPLSLMKYLVRLVTPPNGVVCDPFCGSGTTALACKAQGFNFICIDNNPEYIEIAKKRLADMAGRKPEIKSDLW